MTPKSPKDSMFTDTQKELLALGAEIGESISKRREEDDDEDEHRSSPLGSCPAANDSSEHMRLLVRDEIHCHENHCERMRQMEIRMDKTDKQIVETRDFMNQYLGEEKFIRYAVPLLVGVASSSVMAVVFGLLLKALRVGH
jgi:hypothetical protein